MKHVNKIMLGIILLTALYIRTYKIDQFLVFLGDEGRDVLVVKGILEGNLTLLGPRASAGDFFTGPIYYYMMAPFLWLFRLDPVGPAIMVALFGVATVYLVYYAGKLFFNSRAGLVASALYAVSPLVVTYSRSSWNPNVVPFFSLLIIVLLYKALTKMQTWKYFLAIGFLLGIAVQLHYISLFLGVGVAISMLIIHLYLHKKEKLVLLGKQYIQIFLGFIAGFSPFLAFEFRHNFQNMKAIGAFILGSNAEKGYATYDVFYQPVIDVFFRLFARLVFNYPDPLLDKNFPIIFLQMYGVVIVLLALSAILVLLKNKNTIANIILITWMVIGIILFGLYKKPIYDYYMVFLFPLPFLLIGNFIARVSMLKSKKLSYGMFVSAIMSLTLVLYNIFGLPLSSPNSQKEQTKKIASFVLSKTANKPYNFALITPGNSDHAYRYYFEVLGHNPTGIEIEAVDPQRKTVTDQLMVICEGKECNPLGHPLYEIAGFGPAKVAGKWTVVNVEVFRLIREHKTD